MVKKRTEKSLEKKENKKYNLQVNLAFNLFNKYNLSIPKKWNEMRDLYKIYFIFDKWFFSNKKEFDLNLVFNDFKKELRVLKKTLNRLDKEAKILELNDYLSEKPDNEKFWSDLRPASNTYGFENIYNDLSYISDRWNCQFRLRWLIEVIEKNFKYKKITKNNQETWIKI